MTFAKVRTREALRSAQRLARFLNDEAVFGKRGFSRHANSAYSHFPCQKRRVEFLK